MADQPRVLIVDDEPNIRDLLTTSLRFAGFAVRAVGNGAQAISAVLEEEPDLIILDVMLPDMNGFGVTKRLRASGYTVADPVPHREGRHRGQDHRPHGRRRRLRHQAVQPRRDRRAHQGDPAPHDARRGGRRHPRRRAHDGPGHPRGDGRQRADRALPDRVQAAALPDAEPEPGALEGADPRPRLGVRLQRRRRHRRSPTSPTCGASSTRTARSRSSRRSAASATC